MLDHSLATPLVAPAVPARQAAFFLVVAASLAAGLLMAPGVARGEEGDLQTMRDDVRQGLPPAPTVSSPPAYSEHDDRSAKHVYDDEDAVDTAGVYIWASAAAITSPIWAPVWVLGDSYAETYYFPRFPYDDTDGYLTNNCLDGSRRWSARLDVDYTSDLDRLDSLGGHLLLETSGRFGIDVAGAQYEERLADGDRDRLQLGDANLVFRFAQSPRAEFRTGLGFNWLDAEERTDFGFNFTYGADFYLRKPWIVSSAIDWGTLGRTGLFRLRLTTGVIVHGIETYTGYEYLDIGRTDSNALVAGLRVWF